MAEPLSNNAAILKRGSILACGIALSLAATMLVMALQKNPDQQFYNSAAGQVGWANCAKLVAATFVPTFFVLWPICTGIIFILARRRK